MSFYVLDDVFLSNIETCIIIKAITNKKRRRFVIESEGGVHDINEKKIEVVQIEHTS